MKGSALCSDPQDFTDKETGEVVTVACRVCNDCIATRRNGWVSRAMAEKLDFPHTLCLALTYSDATPEGRDGARMFCYADVRAFMQSIRDAARAYSRKAKLNQVPVLRFLCAGEQGDRNGRCHWHLIIYSNVDLTLLGKFSMRGLPVIGRADMISVGKRKRRLNWSLWGFGFVTLQEPDEGGMKYVLSYCLKDQFTVEKSEGTMRETSAENFATGLFRMSKRPAIGENWLMQKMEKLDALGAVLPSLDLRVPDMGGYWQPSGTFRKKLLWCLVALNKRALWATGANAPQWSSLVASLSENQPELEILLGKEKELDETDGWYSSVHARGRWEAGQRDVGATLRNCGRSVPCYECLNGFDDEKLASLALWRRQYQTPDGRHHSRYYSTSGQTYDERRGEIGGLNSDCQQRGSKAIRRAFPRSGGETL